MAGERLEIPMILLGLLWTTPLVSSFNLEPQAGYVLNYPYRTTEERESYFGYSVALQHHAFSNTNWLIVGAPRANSSYNNKYQITEPGAVFKCDLSKSACEELNIDESENTVTYNEREEFIYQDLKNHGWLGGSLDSQPIYHGSRQMTGVCAPLWKNQYYTDTYFMNGACYWMNESLPNAPAKKVVPLVYFSRQTRNLYDLKFYNYAHGQAGFSIHFPDDPTKVIVGAPGVFNWQGTVVLFKDYEWNNSGGIARRRRSAQALKNVFSTQLVPDPYYITSTRDFDLMGYAVTSGNFVTHNQTHYATGAPRGADAYGKVIIFDFPLSEYADLKTLKELTGQQLGEYFGAALTAADVNGDGLSDLVVGSPMYFSSDLIDMGRIEVFLSVEGRGPQASSTTHYGREVSTSRFGTTLASPGDLNADGFQDVVVGAPWEERGAVYVFLGSSSGLRQKYSQRLSPKDFPQHDLSGFGISISRGIDIDSNGYPDLAIGSFLSGHAVVVRSRPVAVLFGQVTADPPNIPWEGKATLTLKTCLQYRGYKIPRHSTMQGKLTLDHSSPAPRAVFSDNSIIHTFTERVITNKTKCRLHNVTVKEDKIDPDQPLVMKLEYELGDTYLDLQLTEQAMTNPIEVHSNLTRVSIVKGCAEEVCKVDVMLIASFINMGHDNKLVIGKVNEPVLRVNVSNTGEPAYLPNMTVSVGPPLTLYLPSSHDCKFPDPDKRTSLECSLSNPIKYDKRDAVDVKVDASQLTDGSNQPEIRVNVAGEGDELKQEDNHLSLSLQLEAHASLEIHGYSKEEQVLYELLDEEQINATISPRFIHSYTVIKKGPTPLGHVNLVMDIPVNFTDSSVLLKVYPPETSLSRQPFNCKLNGANFYRDTHKNSKVNSDSSTSSIDDGDVAKSPAKPLIVKTEKEAFNGAQYFNCSSNLVQCAQLSCNIYEWPAGTASAKLSVELEVNLSTIANHISGKSGAVLSTTATASIYSLSSKLTFVGERMARKSVMTNIQPDSLSGEGVPWWVILLAVLGGLLLLGLIAYGFYKAGFFKRQEMEEMKAHRARLESPQEYGTSNPANVAD